MTINVDLKKFEQLQEEITNQSKHLVQLEIALKINATESQIILDAHNDKGYREAKKKAHELRENLKSGKRALKAMQELEEEYIEKLKTQGIKERSQILRTEN